MNNSVHNLTHNDMSAFVFMNHTYLFIYLFIVTKIKLLASVGALENKIRNSVGDQLNFTVHFKELFKTVQLAEW